MSTEGIEPDYDAVPFPSDTSSSRPSLHDMYQNFQHSPATVSHLAPRAPVYDPTGSGPGNRRTVPPHSLTAPDAYSYPGPQQPRPNVIDLPETGPPGRYIPWYEGSREDLERDPEKCSTPPKDPVQEKGRLTAAEFDYERLQAMNTKEREKYLKTKRIEFHVTCRHPTSDSFTVGVDV